LDRRAHRAVRCFTGQRPWMWSLDPEFYQGREQTHGYEATREAAMQALARCWSPRT
jgi:hypothetical protein